MRMCIFLRLDMLNDGPPWFSLTMINHTSCQIMVVTQGEKPWFWQVMYQVPLVAGQGRAMVVIDGQWWFIMIHDVFRLSAILDHDVGWFSVVNDSWSWWMIGVKSSWWLIIVNHYCWQILPVDHGSWWFLVSNDGWAWSMSLNDDCDSQLWWMGDPYY